MKSPKLISVCILAATIVSSFSFFLLPTPKASACNTGWGILDPTCPGRILNPGKPAESDTGTREYKNCLKIDARKGWQTLPNFEEIDSIGGGWSVDAANYPMVGPGGHTGDAARALAPYNVYKYDQKYPFGALLFLDQNGNNVPFSSSFVNNRVPPNLKHSRGIHVRINDADKALGDNGGALEFCGKSYVH
ncbi:hypothetical protein PCC9214_00664 [Planktothrix tepida]|uniref:Uncharacterized protein n=1 Tax=Planktothrix tepida PCC 9214 TaxID=671072 RepID=A0A1J1LEF0_9CYAN|nr:hypothetical protein [Planktothrix tepida]CAD5921113.1 hypothetical protein PCC9214_00664 [Planktothrix tepida]CUR30955.1 conserved exported hypothetical protein [Planktothrix tepida PCC 9214]